MKKLILPLMFGVTPLIASSAVGTYVCDYPKYSDSKGIHRSTEKFELTFVIDQEKGTGYALGNQASAEVKMLISKDQLILIEMTASGNIVTTTITSGGDSVHSRHIVIGDKIVASQNYGKCVRK